MGSSPRGRNWSASSILRHSFFTTAPSPGPVPPRGGEGAHRACVVFGERRIDESVIGIEAS